MHEISLVNSIINTLDTEYKDKVERIVRIKMKIGELSNIQPILMQNAFEAVVNTNHPNYKGKILDIEFLNVIIQCPICDTKTEVKNYKFVCDNCKTPSNNIIQGTELLISGVEMLIED